MSKKSATVQYQYMKHSFKILYSNKYTKLTTKKLNELLFDTLKIFDKVQSYKVERLT